MGRDAAKQQGIARRAVPGNALLLTLEYQHATGLFSGDGAIVEEHLAGQPMRLMAVARSRRFPSQR